MNQKQDKKQQAIEVLKGRLATAVNEIRRLNELLWKAQQEVNRLQAKLRQHGDEI